MRSLRTFLAKAMLWRNHTCIHLSHILLRRLPFVRYRPNHRRIEIDVTYACNLKCTNCNRSSTQQPSSAALTLEHIERFIAESIQDGRKWQRIRVLGGEPTLHPEIIGILEALLAYKRNFYPKARITLVTNGHGARVAAVLARIPDGIIIENTSKTGGPQTFDTFNVAPIDLPKYANADFTRACPYPHYCGVGLTPHGYYPCAIGGGIDRVFGFGVGRMALPPDDETFRAELDLLCRHCGHFKWDGEKADTAVISESWREAYGRPKAERPAIRRF